MTLLSHRPRIGVFVAAFAYVGSPPVSAAPRLCTNEPTTSNRHHSEPSSLQTEVAHIVDALNRPSIGLFLGGDRDGTRVVKVLPGSPAQAAGVMVGEVFVRVDGQVFKEPSDVVHHIGAHNVGDYVVLTTASEKTYKVQLTRASDVLEARYPSLYSEVIPSWRLQTGLIRLCDLDVHTAKASEIEWRSSFGQGGVLVTLQRPGGDECGLESLKQGDVIVRVGDYPVSNALDFVVHCLGALREDADVRLISEQRAQTKDENTVVISQTHPPIHGGERLLSELERLYSTFQDEPK